MTNKRGQFYIVAAIIIVLAISGIASVKTYADTKPKPRTIESMSEELKKEGYSVVDYGIYTPGEDPVTKLEDFIDNKYGPYFLKKTEQANIFFIYGDRTNLYSIMYQEVNAGTITATIGSGGTVWNIPMNYADRADINEANDIDPITEEITITILEQEFKFKIKDNEMFYFVMMQEKEGERYVERN